MSIPDLDIQACRGRQRRLIDAMQKLDVELAIVSRMESVQWLTGARVGPLFQSAAAIDLSGRVTLVLPSRKVQLPAAADEVLPYEEKWLSTMRDASDQQVACVDALLKPLGDLPRQVACEFTGSGALQSTTSANLWIDLDAVMFRLRRSKDPDEVQLMRRANEANRVMYQLAREIIKPGVNELDLFSELHAAAVSELGEPLTYLGQDFRAGARGGAPRDRQAEAGELWILDLGVGLRGYHTDNARTIAVDGSPTDIQLRAWERIVPVFPMVEESVKPGVSCRALFDQAQQMLADGPGVFNHHLGHGVGLAPHEGPHLNPNWDDTFQPGDFLAVEPGLYDDELRHGIRLEQNYVVTESGVELLTDWPLEL